MGSMALIVFFRGINVGGHRAFRPSVLAEELSKYLAQKLDVEVAGFAGVEDQDGLGRVAPEAAV